MTDVQKANYAVPAVKADKFERESLTKWAEKVDVDRKPLLKKASLVFLIVFVFGGIWSVTAHLGGAVVAQGKVMAEGKNRLIQHLEGGILKEVLVKEGDQVKAGQILAKLDTLQINAQLESNRLQRAIARVQLARRRAEVHEMEAVSFPTDLDPEIANHPRVIEAIESQLEEFNAGTKFRQASEDIIDTRIQGLRGDIEGQNEVLQAYERQLELYELELRDFRVLLEQGHIARTRVFATERRVVELKASMANTRLAIKKSENEILNLETEKKRNKLEFLQNANRQLVDIQKLMSSADAQVTRLVDMLDRTVIRSPDAGTVFQQGKRTIGEVVKPGDTLFVLFPEDDALTVEAQLAPSDRDKIHIGQYVQVVFPTDRINRLTPLDGSLVYISADTITSQQDPVGHYILRVEVDPGSRTSKFLPGNVAEVFIKTEPMTFATILASPFTRFTQKAFTE